MLEFLSLLVLAAVAYLIWRVTDQLPDLIFRLSEIQRDVAEVRRRIADESEPQRLDSSTTSTVASSTTATTTTAADSVESDV